MATETAMPSTITNVATAQQYRDRYRPFQTDIVDDNPGGTSLVVTDGGAGGSINIANGGAIVQGCRYDLTAGPKNIAVAANGGGSNRFDIVCLTYDSSHNPVVYSRIVQGTPGAGLPALTNSQTGVWDFPIYHYEKTPAGAIVNIRDRRRFGDGLGETVCADDTNGTNGIGWFPQGPRIGQVQTFWPSNIQYKWDGTRWMASGRTCTPTFTAGISNSTAETLLTTIPVAFEQGIGAGRTYRGFATFNAQGTTSTPTFTVRMYVDSTAGTLLYAHGSPFQVAGGVQQWNVEFWFQVAPSGNVRQNIAVNENYSQGGSANRFTDTSSHAISNASLHSLIVTGQFSAASATNTAVGLSAMYMSV